MAVKRKTQEIHKELVEKRAKSEVAALTNLPDSLQLRILYFLNTKYAVQTSALSKTCVSLWKSVPVLDFNSLNFRKIRAFDKFVYKVLLLRDHSLKLDSLFFSRRGVCSFKMLNNVLGYAFSHGVKNVEVCIRSSRIQMWPVTCSESLVSLKLQSECAVGCPFLGPRSGSFKNLSALYLRGANISDPEPFSGFPVLKKLTLRDCLFDNEAAWILNIRALQLTHLTISSGYDYFKSCKLTAPELSFFEYVGPDIPLFQRSDDEYENSRPDTVTIDFHGNGISERVFGGLISLFEVVGNVKLLKLSTTVVYIMYLFKNKLEKQDSLFHNLKCLKVDPQYHQYSLFKH